MGRTIFDKLLLSSVTDGDWRIHDLEGLSRLTPFQYIGSKQLSHVTIGGYYNCPDLAQFRIAVREIRAYPPPTIEKENCAAQKDVAKELRRGTKKWNKWLACPNLFDLDTRNLYFGQINQHPGYAKLKVGQDAKPEWNDPMVLKGLINDCTGKPWEPGPEGRAVKGMPVRLQQVHFQAYNPAGDLWSHCAEEQEGATIQNASQEYAAYFLVSNPVGPIPETPEEGCPDCGEPGVEVCIDSEFNLQRKAGVVYWTSNKWTLSGSEEVAIKEWPERLVIGSKDPGTMLFDQLSEALAEGGGLDTGEKAGEGKKCLPRIVTHVYATQCGLKYNYVELSKTAATDNCPAGIQWTAGIEPIINFTDCKSSSCSPSSTSAVQCGPSSSSLSCPSESSASLPSEIDQSKLLGGGQIGCPQDYCPQMS